MDPWREPTLYLAFPKTEAVSMKLATINPKLLTIFELEEFTAQNGAYIGKKTESFPTLDQLNNLESHLTSVMQRLQLPLQGVVLLAKECC